jgi:putative addiction module component (TIGR02574 family)
MTRWERRFNMSEFEELTTRALALPAKGRAELAELLIQSLEEADDKNLKAAWLVEIHRRDQEIRAGASVTKPADEVLREAREHLRCLK